jgi:hypothetical protein
MVSRKVVFYDDNAGNKFHYFATSTSENQFIKQKLDAAFKILMDKPNAGEHVQKGKIPKSYKKKGITDLYKYNLTKSWRLMYFLERNDNVLYIVIVDWLSHSDYNKLFGYG